MPRLRTYPRAFVAEYPALAYHRDEGQRKEPVAEVYAGLKHEASDGDELKQVKSIKLYDLCIVFLQMNIQQ